MPIFSNKIKKPSKVVGLTFWFCKIFSLALLTLSQNFLHLVLVIGISKVILEASMKYGKNIIVLKVSLKFWNGMFHAG